MKLATILTLAATLVGCTLMLGKTYQRYENVPGGMGVIYVYTGDITPLQQVHIDRDPDTDGATHTLNMIKGGYFAYLMQPGFVRVLSGPEGAVSCVLLSVQAGSQHWVRAANTDPRVTVVPEEVAQKEIGGHREISAESRAAATGSFPAECKMLGE